MEIRSAVVIGASRGLGLAITEEILSMESIQSVTASYRSEDTVEALCALEDPRLRRLPLEVTDEASFEAFVGSMGQGDGPPQLVIHCAGILHEPGLSPEKSLRQCRAEALQRIFAVNSIGPVLTAKHLIPLMPKREASHFAALSAMVGSIGDNRLGGWYGYRASKAALNQLLKTVSIECKRTHPGLCVSAIHPGTTDTDLSQPFQGNVKPDKLYSPRQSARRIIRVVLAGSPEDSGRFVNWDGSLIPW